MKIFLKDVIKTMNGIIKDERAKIEKFRESDHKHYQESVDELHRKKMTNLKKLKIYKLFLTILT